MKKIRMIISILIIFILCFVSFQIGNKISSAKTNTDQTQSEEKMYYLEYGDDFSELYLQTYDGKQITLPKTKDKYQLVFYLDTRCSTCMNQLVAVKHLESIFQGDMVEIKIVWSGDFKVENIEKLGLQKEHNFYLERAKINSATPTCYVLDSNNKIIFETPEVAKALEKIKLSEEGNKEIIIKKCNKYFLNINKELKPIMVSFLMDGCKDCENAEPIVQKDSIQQKYSIYDIYTEESYGNKEFVDIGNVFYTIYDLEWYPSFLLIDNNGYKVIGNTPLEDLEQDILDAI